MTEPTGALERECVAFTRFLTGLQASEYVRRRYITAHRMRSELASGSAWEIRLVTFATRGSLHCRLADAFAVLVEPGGLLRRKLVLLLAVLETCPPYCESLEELPHGGWVPAVLGLTVRGTVAMTVAVMALCMFLPLRFLRRFGGR